MASINETFVFEVGVDGGLPLSACTGVFTSRIDSCEGDTTIFINQDSIDVTKSIIPLVDGGQDLGTPIQRFRQVNSISGISSVWSSTEKVITPRIDLGLDLDGNNRELNADNLIIQNDTLIGGVY
jgi:hypothetical protein